MFDPRFAKLANRVRSPLRRRVSLKSRTERVTRPPR